MCRDVARIPACCRRAPLCAVGHRPECTEHLVRFVDVAAEAGLDLVNVSGGACQGLHRGRQRQRRRVLRLRQRRRPRRADRQRIDPRAARHGRRPDGRALPERRQRPVHATSPPSSGFTRRGWGAGVCVADYDNDGLQDVYVTAFGPDVLWRNNGNGTFTDVTRRAGFDDTRWSTSCAFADYDHDGDLDLYVANYVQFDDKTIPARGTTANCRFMATDVFCGPKRLPGEADVLYRNNGDGTFTDVTAPRRHRRPGLLRLRCGVHRPQRRRLAGHLRGQRLGAQPALPQPARTARSSRRAWSPGAR